MFSTHMPQMNTVPREWFYVGAGAVLIIGLLMAIGSVASGEVRKAQARDSLLASQKSAVAHCVATLRGTALNACVQQARADLYNDGGRVMAAGDNGDSRKEGAMRTSHASGAPLHAAGLLPVSFKAVQ